MLNVLITIDYELFGNGKGDVREHVVNPMDKILNICDKHSVPITLMFEVMEYITFRKHDEKLRKKLGYSPKKLIEKQIRSAYKNGHDVQLHIHPQFRNMRFDGKKFILDQDLIPYLELSSQEVERILRQGMNVVKTVIDNPSYQCRTLRLSNFGWKKVPKNTIEPMKNLGLKVHSLTDKIPDNRKGYWEVDNGIYEIPIHSHEVEFLRFLSLKKVFLYLYIWSHIRTEALNKGSDSVEAKKRNELLNRINAKWDLSKLSHSEMTNFLEEGKKRYDFENYEVPLVMIGHTKDFFNCNHFSEFLKILNQNRQDNIKFTTMDLFIDNNLM